MTSWGKVMVGHGQLVVVLRTPWRCYNSGVTQATAAPSVSPVDGTTNEGRLGSRRCISDSSTPWPNHGSSRILHLVERGEVHVWSEPVDATEDLEGNLELLDDAERAQAGRFRFDLDRVRFVLRRAFARRVLARYLGVHPAAVRIRTSRLGRPELDPPCGLAFNTSHSDGMAVVAVAQGQRVGIDIERVREIESALDVAEGLFAAPEVEWLRSVSSGSCSRAFLALWTRKEAVVKALGGGLSIPLDGFSVLANTSRGIERSTDLPGSLSLLLKDLSEPQGYVGSIASVGPQFIVRHMDVALANR
jgi:4'-phosphopantetheinyl transferase